MVYAPPPVAGYSPPGAVYEPVLPYPPVEAAAPVVTAQYPLADTSQLPGRLRSAAARLAQSLSLRRGDADVWLDYLGPDLIVDVIDRGADPSTLRDLVANYDGVVSNGSLISIRSASGFSETRSLLRQYVSGAAASAAKPAVPTPPQPPADAPPEPNPEDSEPVPPPLPVPPPPTEPDLPRAQAEPTPAESIKTATGGEVPTPL